ncbi:O-antigen ligase [Acidipila sp. EB88]|uniref:O-antigen ligase family protein n=1 Tax=Acidipila sp. EB88 TaxID=2305226 RepID=UPI00131574E8|nr:O-antigen ligase family protein [Acidipila sp. EB88]
MDATPISAPRKALSSYALTYLVLFGLLFLAVSGGFSFDTPGVKTDAGFAPDERNLEIVRTQGDDLRRIIETVLFLPALLYLIYRNKDKVIAGSRDMKIFLAMPVLAIASTLWSQMPVQTFRSGIYLLINTLFAIYFVAVYDPDEQMEILVLLGRFFLVANILFSLLVPKYGIEREISGIVTWQGICLHKNICAYATVFLAAPVFFQKLRGTLDTLGRIVYVALSLFVVYMTESRTGWILCGAFCALLAFFWLQRKFRSYDALALLLTIVVVGSLAAWSVYGLLPIFFVAIGKDPTLSGRTDIWQAVFRSVMKKPLLGWGYHGFWTGLTGESGVIAAEVLWNPGFAHSGYLETWLDVGAVGLGMALYTLVRGLLQGARCLLDGGAPYIEWCFTTLVLTVIINIDEISLLGSLQLEWTLFITSCALLLRENRRLNAMAVR